MNLRSILRSCVSFWPQHLTNTHRESTNAVTPGGLQLCAASASDPAFTLHSLAVPMALRLFTSVRAYHHRHRGWLKGAARRARSARPGPAWGAGSCRACRRAPLSPPEGKPRWTGGRERSEPVPVCTARFAPTLPRWQSSRAVVSRVGGNLASLFVYSPTPESTAQVRRDMCKQ